MISRNPFVKRPWPDLPASPESIAHSHGGWASLPRYRSDRLMNFRVAHPSLFERCVVLTFRMSLEAQSRGKLHLRQTCDQIALKILKSSVWAHYFLPHHIQLVEGTPPVAKRQMGHLKHATLTSRQFNRSCYHPPVETKAGLPALPVRCVEARRSVGCASKESKSYPPGER